jgi:hypothetical protein
MGLLLSKAISSTAFLPLPNNSKYLKLAIFVNVNNHIWLSSLVKAGIVIVQFTYKEL